MRNVESAANQIKDLVQHSRTVLIVTRTGSSGDDVAASLALSESIRAFGRSVVLATPEPLTDDVKVFPGADQFTTHITPRSLVVSLDLEQGTLDKISYGPEGPRFNLVITPKAGKQVSQDNVSYSHTGVAYDLVFVLGTADLALLGPLYESEKEVWQHLPLVNIDEHPANTQYGKVNVLDHEASSTSEITYRVLSAAKLPLPKISAELLLEGIRRATGNFTKSEPGSFEVAAELSRRIKGGDRVESTEERLVNEPFRKEHYLKIGAKLLD